MDNNNPNAMSPDAVRAHIRAGICPFCGKGPFMNIALHTNRAHGVDKVALRTRARMLTSEPMCSPELSELMSIKLESNPARLQKFRANGQSEGARNKRTGKHRIFVEQDGKRAYRAVGNNRSSGNYVYTQTPEAKEKRRQTIALRVGARKNSDGSLVPEDPRHGTANGYHNHKCRCERCKTAWNAYCKMRRQARKTRPRVGG